MDHLNGHYAGRHRDHAIAKDHYDRGKAHAEGGVWRDVPVADRGQGHYGPVYASGYAGKAVLSVLDQVHERAQHHDRCHDGCQKYGYLLPAGPERLDYVHALGQVLEELEGTEYAEHAQHPYYQEVPASGQKKVDVGGYYREQVYNAEEARGVLQGPCNAHEPQCVFDCKEDGEEPLGRVERAAVLN